MKASPPAGMLALVMVCRVLTCRRRVSHVTITTYVNVSTGPVDYPGPPVRRVPPKSPKPLARRLPQVFVPLLPRYFFRSTSTRLDTPTSRSSGTLVIHHAH